MRWLRPFFSRHMTTGAWTLQLQTPVYGILVGIVHSGVSKYGNLNGKPLLLTNLRHHAACVCIFVCQIYPDFSAQREMRQFHVYCMFKLHGCSQIMPWSQYKVMVLFCVYTF